MMPGSGEFSRAPGWLARTAHWSDGENLKTDSSRPRSVYRTLSKTGRRIVVLSQIPHPREGLESGRCGPPPPVLSPWRRGVWAREQNGPLWRSDPPPSESRCCLLMGEGQRQNQGPGVTKGEREWAKSAADQQETD